MVKDLQQEFLQARIHKAKDEIAKVLAKYQLLLSAELSYNQGAILPVIKLVQSNEMQEVQEQVAEAPETPEVAVEEAASEAE